MNPANDEKLTEKAWLAMGAALLRTAERNGAVLTDEARTQFQSAMTALAQADTEKSVCAALPATDEAVLEVWKAAGLLAENEKAGTPLVLDRDEVRHRLYTSRQFAEEAELARRFVRAAAAPGKAVAMPESLETVFRERDRSFFERSREAEDAAKRQEWTAGVGRQYDAVKRALTHRFSDDAFGDGGARPQNGSHGSHGESRGAHVGSRGRRVPRGAGALCARRSGVGRKTHHGANDSSTPFDPHGKWGKTVGSVAPDGGCARRGRSGHDRSAIGAAPDAGYGSDGDARGVSRG